MKGIIKFLVIAVMFILFVIGCNTAGYRKTCDEKNRCKYIPYLYIRD